MARIVVRNALFLGRRKVSTLTIPWATYTEPEIAHVGLHEKDARSHGIPHRVFMQKLDDVDRAILDSEDEGFVKILTPPKSDAILGATIVSAHASEMISEITVAMVAGVGLGAISNTIHPYPTQAEAIKKIGDAYLRSRLTPLVQTMLKKWLAWTG
ncbi:MAG: hypothetical protein KatS3mg105_1559 [Gemmatales bacterium]|nr:MAG: hypothetical protein KatS3mg105_1559 [Gemmatales bacterium]